MNSGIIYTNEPHKSNYKELIGIFVIIILSWPNRMLSTTKGIYLRSSEPIDVCENAEDLKYVTFSLES